MQTLRRRGNSSKQRHLERRNNRKSENCAGKDGRPVHITKWKLRPSVTSSGFESPSGRHFSALTATCAVGACAVGNSGQSRGHFYRGDSADVMRQGSGNRLDFLSAEHRRVADRYDLHSECPQLCSGLHTQSVQRSLNTIFAIQRRPRKRCKPMQLVWERSCRATTRTGLRPSIHPDRIARIPQHFLRGRNRTVPTAPTRVLLRPDGCVRDARLTRDALSMNVAKGI